MNGGDPPSTDESLPSETLENVSLPIDGKSEASAPPPDVSESSDALARAISSVLASVIRDFDHRAENAGRSQDELCSAIDRLTRGIFRSRMIRVLFCFCMNYQISWLNLIFLIIFLVKMVNLVSPFWVFI